MGLEDDLFTHILIGVLGFGHVPCASRRCRYDNERWHRVHLDGLSRSTTESIR